MSNFMDRLMGRRANAAKSAKDRLKVVLVTDRAQISPEELRMMQHEILQVIQKYCRIDASDIDLKYEQRERENYLVADILLTPRADGDAPSSVRLETSLEPIREEENEIEDTGLIRVEMELDEFSTREFDPQLPDDLLADENTEITEIIRKGDAEAN